VNDFWSGLSVQVVCLVYPLVYLIDLFVSFSSAGDLMGPSIQGLDNLLQMPYGCGEQNMLFFAPDVYIVKYLSISGQLTEDIKDKALDFMLAGDASFKYIL